SGDHLKSASDLGLDFVGVGLLYRSGYFHQTVDAGGHQQHIYPKYDFTRLPLRPVQGLDGQELVVSIPVAHREVFAKVWKVQVGRVPLLLLDTDIQQNAPTDRHITGQLYVRGRAMRLLQEIVLGIGGVRALDALKITPSVFHINEGHSALLQLQRLEDLGGTQGIELEKALEPVRQRTVFTTHTPVPAGNERFDIDLAKRYLGEWAARLGTSKEEILALGRADLGDGDVSLNLTALALRTSRYSNGVSQLHGEVSRSMWRPLYPEATDDSEVPIHHVTNGVHLPSWMGTHLRTIVSDHLGSGWENRRPEELLPRIDEIPNEDVWAAHSSQKHRLGRFLRGRLRDQFARHGCSPEDLLAVDDYFDPEALTLGFARRFATYKRAKLIFSDPHELRRLVSDPERPIQIVFAGKAHPADRPGQEMIQHIFQLSRSEPFIGRVFFLEDYDLRIGRMLVQGVDVWLNTPQRPKEASGTSGQKAAMNGALNCSILDGWWPEAFDSMNGWAIQVDHAEGIEDAQRDQAEAQALYRILSEEIVPSFYGRVGGAAPADWVRRMKQAILTVAPAFSSDRMVRDYTNQAYYPSEE
ncbi:MAG: alpha-glucan family phosphorylase, partial [Thermoanaerobaculia bacterium]|nr:alpha-glucan family phosphorylase [Thermoanaerobaculia bacterium]